MKTLEELKAMSKQEFVKYMNENMTLYEGCVEGNWGQINNVGFYVYIDDTKILEYALEHKSDEWNKKKLEAWNIEKVEDIENLEDEERELLLQDLYDGNDREIDDYYMAEQKEDIIMQLEDNGYGEDDEVEA